MAIASSPFFWLLLQDGLGTIWTPKSGFGSKTTKGMREQIAYPFEMYGAPDKNRTCALQLGGPDPNGHGTHHLLKDVSTDNFAVICDMRVPV